MGVSQNMQSVALLLGVCGSALALQAPRAPGVAASRRAAVRMGVGAAPFGTPADFRDSVERALGSNAKKHIALLGSTGSIGTQTLDIVREYAEHFEVISLSAGSNVELLAKQVAEFKPTVVGLAAAEKLPELLSRLKDLGVSSLPEIVTGPDGQIAAAVAPGADTVVTGVVGVAGLLPTIEAIKLGRTIALANKETLIAGGCAPRAAGALVAWCACLYSLKVAPALARFWPEPRPVPAARLCPFFICRAPSALRQIAGSPYSPIILPLLEKHGAKMTAADSEHSAIFQCLQGVPPGALRRVILTASGGAFRDFTAEDLIAKNKGVRRTRALPRTREHAPRAQRACATQRGSIARRRGAAARRQMAGGIGGC